MSETENVSDRELFSELFENPIYPLEIHMVPPFVDENSPMYYLQLNGEAALRWREVSGKPRTVFQLLQKSVKPLGYRFEESARERVGHAIDESIRRFWRKMQDTKDGKKRKKNANGDLDKTGHKTGGDPAVTKRRVGAAHARKQSINSIQSHNETHIKISITRSLQVQSTYPKNYIEWL